LSRWFFHINTEVYVNGEKIVEKENKVKERRGEERRGEERRGVARNEIILYKTSK